MTISIHEASVPVFTQMLTGVSTLLDKLCEQAAVKKIDPVLFLNERLYPNMFTYGRQLQAMCDWASNTTAWLAGVSPPKFDNTERTIADWQARIKKTLDFIASADAAAINGAEEKDIVYPAAGGTRQMKGKDFLLHQALPQFYFHVTIAYAILRARGIDCGKRDFMGPIPRMTQLT
ncbi:MAG TPA: DUF1993 domain-containing protein [Beijerinckiaceae bacterium]|jgi:hypothetical protein|nr:DUF1993 domain-containing protein [Beijerinckiaceae bacterium]